MHVHSSKMHKEATEKRKLATFVRVSRNFKQNSIEETQKVSNDSLDWTLWVLSVGFKKHRVAQVSASAAAWVSLWVKIRVHAQSLEWEVYAASSIG